MTPSADGQAIALFRYGLIADALHLPVGSRGLYECLRKKAAADHTIPGSSRTRVAAETLRHWVKAYRRGGFEALYPKGRKDRGRSRALPQALADALVSAKEDKPHLSIPQLIAAVGETLPDSGVQPAPSTVHRLLARAGLMDKAAVGDGASGADRRRFAFAEPGQLWMDAYANCFVRRNRPTQGFEVDTPAKTPRTSGIALRDLRALGKEQG